MDEVEQIKGVSPSEEIKDWSEVLRTCGEKQDAQRWNQLRKKYRKAKIVLEKQDFSGLDLSRFNLQNIMGDGCKFHQTLFKQSLLSNASLKNCDFYGAIFEETAMVSVHLTHSIFSTAKFSRVDLRFSSFEYADIHQADFMSCDFSNSLFQHSSIVDSNILSSKLYGAALEGAEWSETDLSGSSFERANVDGKTMFWDCYYDKDTDFSGVGLGSCRIEPTLAAAFAANNRRIWWKKWYLSKRESINKEKWYGKINQLTNEAMIIIIKLFWWATDYGSSTMRLLGVFSINILIFSLFYALFPQIIFEPGVTNWDNPILSVCRTFYFSIIVMTSVGFGDFHASANSPISLIIISFQAIIGYILLGAFLVRIGILFQGEFPAPAVKKKGRDHQ